MNNSEKAAIKYIRKVTNGSFDLKAFKGRKMANPRRAVIALITGELPSESHSSFTDMENALKQNFNIGELQEPARRDFLKRLYEEMN